MRLQLRPSSAWRSAGFRSASSAGLIGLLGVLSGCQAKGPDFFGPPSSSSNSQQPSVDNTPPIFLNQFPSSALAGPFAINSVRVDINDLIGTNGVAASGIDPSSVSASINGQSLPVTHSGSTYTASLSGRADGQLGIVWSAKDLAGNFGTSTMSVYLKNFGPVITVPSPPSSTSQSSGTSTSFSIGGSIADSYLFKASGTVLKPGPSNVCGNSDNTPWPLGTGAGQVSGNSWDYTNSVLSNGTFNLGATAFNPVGSGGMPTTLRYCFGVTAEDKAMDATGAAKHNVSTRYFTVDQTWLPPMVAFTLSTTATYRHIIPGVSSEVCVTINTTPAQADQAYQLGISGPGVVGPTNISGTLASGSLVVRVPINQFGSYSGSVAVNGQTSTYSVSVTSANGTCT
jgi:hypothetical protein